MFEILFALLPMAILIISMGICKWPGDKSSLLTLAITVILAVFAFGTPVQEIGSTLINSTARACITILSVIWMAVFSYNILLDSGKIEILKKQLAAISTDKSVQVLLITWGFGGLLEGMAGYGTSVAIRHTCNTWISPVVCRAREPHRQQRTHDIRGRRHSGNRSHGRNRLPVTGIMQGNHPTTISFHILNPDHVGYIG